MRIFMNLDQKLKLVQTYGGCPESYDVYCGKFLVKDNDDYSDYYGNYTTGKSKSVNLHALWAYIQSHSPTG